MTEPRRPILPAVLDEIAAHAGADAALALAARYGGRTWRVPKSLDDDAGAALTELAGGEAAAALIGALGGYSLEIPLARRAVAGWLASRGHGTAEIARRLKIAYRTARRYRRGIHADHGPLPGGGGGD
ncbi:MAG: hypothetical protein GDA47_00270 [Rhodospirillales bacterium]|nr:hypothetical protein [Rhodospirillales bacterium]